MVDVIDAFYAQARKQPTNTSIEHLGNQYSYQELATMSKQLAATLLSIVGDRPKVLLALKPSPFAYAGMIGALMVGGTFCPIDMNGPKRRNAEILHSFKPQAILYDPGLPNAPFSEDKKTPRINVQDLTNNISEFAVKSHEHNEAAYVIFTSGSTGRPKGVKIARKAFSHFVQMSQSYFNISNFERWAQYSNLGYDLAVMDVFMTLCHGATLVTFSTPTDKLMPASAIAKYAIDIWQSVPSVVDLMSADNKLDENIRTLRVMSFCGEPLLSTHVDILFKAHPKLTIFNTYGATETTGFNTLNCVKINDYRSSIRGATVALGKDVPGWTIKLLDGPSSDEGHIVVCGDNLSLGYWKDEKRNRVSFRELSIRGRRVRAYYTGDWGERVSNNLFFRGRIDRQVKIKGERIELDEVDFRLREEGFRAVGSVLENDAIYSFVETNEPIDEDTLRNNLSDSLPFHAVPKRILPIDQLPRNQNGKIAFAELRKLSKKIKPDE